MAEHMNQPATARMEGFDALGKPIPLARRQRAYDVCKEMGLDDSARAWECVNGMAEQLERDKPHEAQGVAMRFIDLTGAYRLMAVLLTDPAQPVPAAERAITATLLRDAPGVRTVWLVEVPGPKGTSKQYHAATYPDSDLVSLTTPTRGRSIAPAVAYNLLPLIRDAIKRALDMRSVGHQPN